MLELLGKLLVLQERDQRLNSYLKEIEHIPAEKAALQRELDEAQGEADRAKGRAKEIEVERSSLEKDVAGKQDKIAKYRTQQLETRKNEEYSALQSEIKRAEKEIEEIEDRELELMQEAEDLKPAVVAADKKFAEEKERVNGLVKLKDEKAGVLEVRVGEERAARESVAAEVKGLDEDIFELYEKLFRSKDGHAVVPLDGAHCSGCRVKSTPSILHDAKAGKTIVTCEQCGRIVYYQDEYA